MFLSAILLLDTMSRTVFSTLIIFLGLTLVLVTILLVAKHFLVASGRVKIMVNHDSEIEASSGKSLLSALADENVFLPSACGGKGSCGQCKVQVFEGGGEILPTETVHFTRKQVLDHWRLGCQVKVKQDMSIGVPASVMSVK